jgi:hypothetical protein
MGVMSDDDRMDALLRQLATDEYNRPPDIVPREQMWEAVRQGLAQGAPGTGRAEPGTGKTRELEFVRRVPRWIYFAAAAVLLLAVGIQLGRVMGPGRNRETATVTPNDRRSLGPDSAGALRNDRAPDSQYVDARSDDKGSRPRPRPSEPERQTDPNALDGSSRAYTLVAAQHLVQVEALLTAFKGDLNQDRMDAQMASWGKELLSNTRLLLDSPVASDPVRRKLLQDLELVLVQIVQLSPGTSARDRDLIKGALTDDQVLTRIRTAIPAQKGT